MAKINNGFLISVEGIDGAGKSSLVNELTAEIVSLGFSVVKTKEPGSSELGKYLRQILQNGNFNLSDKAEFLLFAADRAQHFKTIIEPALKAGSIIISDRLADSSLAYQGYGRSLDLEIIKTINSWAMNDIKPNLTIYLKIDYKTALERIIKRQEIKTNFEEENKTFFERVINGFDEIFKNRDNVIVIDATKSLDEIKDEALRLVLPKILN